MLKRSPTFVATALAIGATALLPAAATAATNTISTVAGTGARGDSGDGGPATAAALNFPAGVAATPDGGFLIADTNNNKIRKVSAGGTITTVAGTGTAGAGGDGGPATAATLASPYGLAVTADGGFLIADSQNGRIRKVSPGVNPTITTVAGGGNSNGNGIPASSARLTLPVGVTVLPDGGFLVTAVLDGLVREVSAGASPTITTVAGGGNTLGDAGPATAAQLNQPAATTLLAGGGYLISEANGKRVRRVSPTGIISTFAGTGVFDNTLGDGGPATNAQLAGAFATAATPDGGILIADFTPVPPATPQDPPTSRDARVRKVLGGNISTVVGTGVSGFSGDGQLATAAQLNGPSGLAVLADGDFLIADAANSRIRRVDAGGSDPVQPPSTLPGTPPAALPPATRPAAPLPKLAFSRLGLSPRSPKAKSAAKAKLTFTLNRAGRVGVRLDQIVAGRKSGRKCAKPSRANRKKKSCKRSVKAGSRTISGRTGKNTLTLGSLTKRPKKGSYKITISAPGVKAKTLALTIKK